MCIKQPVTFFRIRAVETEPDRSAGPQADEPALYVTLEIKDEIKMVITDSTKERKKGLGATATLVKQDLIKGRVIIQ
jgi:hypothetical protein